MNMFCVHLILCFLFTAFASNQVEVRTDKGKARESSKEESRVDDIMNSIQGMCMDDNPDQRVIQLKEDTKAILDGIGVYREIVEMNKKLRTELKWIIDESKEHIELNRIVDLLKRDVRDKCSQNKYRDCSDLKRYRKPSGVYSILMVISRHTNGVKAYCDMTTDGGGWTIIQKRFDGSVNFDRGWADYERGFGNVEGEYWLGNQFIHQLTANARYKLRIDLWDANGAHKYAEYATFVIGDSESKYKLTIGGYSGTAGDYLEYSDGMKFSTFDQDNDLWSRNCAVNDQRGAWWSNQCSHSALNRKYTEKLLWNSIFVRSVMMIKQINVY